MSPVRSFDGSLLFGGLLLLLVRGLLRPGGLLPSGAVGVDALLYVAEGDHGSLAYGAAPSRGCDRPSGPQGVGLRACGPCGASGEPSSGLGEHDPDVSVTTGGAGTEVVLLGVAGALGVDALYGRRVAFPDDLQLGQSAYGAGGLHGLHQGSSGKGIRALAVGVSVASDEVPVLG